MAYIKIEVSSRSSVRRLREAQQQLRDLLDEKLSATRVLCPNPYCAHRHKISKLTYLQPMWYEHPYSCTGGDQWHACENGAWECPDCHTRTKIPAGSELAKLRYYFLEIKKLYD